MSLSASRSPASSCAMVIGIPLGILAGMRPGGAVDRMSVTGTSFGLAIPNFVARASSSSRCSRSTLGWFPAQGYTKFSESPSAGCESIILPGHLARGHRGGIGRTRQSRAALIDVLQSNYVRTAFSVGTGTRKTVVKYTFENAAIPTVTVLGLQLCRADRWGGDHRADLRRSPGLGTYMLRALTLPDVPVIQAVTLTFVHHLRDPQPHRRHQLRLPQPAGVQRRRERRTRSSVRGLSPVTSEPIPCWSRTRARARRGDGRRRARRARGGARSGVCSATSPPCSRSGSCCSSSSPPCSRRGRAARTGRDRHRAVRDAELGHIRGHRPPRRDTFSRIIYGAQVSMRSGFQIVGLALLVAVPLGLLAGFRAAARRDAHADHGRPLELPAARARAGRGRHAGRRPRERHPRHLARDDPRVHPAHPRADARGARGDVHRGVASMGTKPGRIRRKRVLPNVASPLIVSVSLAIGSRSSPRRS